MKCFALLLFAFTFQAHAAPGSFANCSEQLNRDMLELGYPIQANDDGTMKVSNETSSQISFVKDPAKIKDTYTVKTNGFKEIPAEKRVIVVNRANGKIDSVKITNYNETPGKPGSYKMTAIQYVKYTYASGKCELERKEETNPDLQKEPFVEYDRELCDSVKKLIAGKTPAQLKTKSMKEAIEAAIHDFAVQFREDEQKVSRDERITQDLAIRNCRAGGRTYSSFPIEPASTTDAPPAKAPRAPAKPKATRSSGAQ